MKVFNLIEQVQHLSSNPAIIETLTAIEFYRGQTYNLPNRIKLNRLHDISKRRSVTSSNEIEGVKVNSVQEKNIFVDKLPPETLEEKMLVGYNDALEYIFNSYKYQQLDEKFILYLHELEWKRVNPAYGGQYKDHQNYIREYFSDGSSRTVFVPLKPEDTPQAMGNLIWQYNDAVNNPFVNKLLLIFVFILDFLCIHPFGDGNGRVSRLLTTFLLIKNGYDLDRYYSTSYLILNRISDYYESLEKSSTGWHENQNDYSHFALYMCGIILDGYKKLNYILSVQQMDGILDDKLLKVINDSNKPISKSDMEELLFSYKRSSIEESLGRLVKNNKIQLIQKGHYSLYYRK